MFSSFGNIDFSNKDFDVSIYTLRYTFAHNSRTVVLLEALNDYFHRVGELFINRSWYEVLEFLLFILLI